MAGRRARTSGPKDEKSTDYYASIARPELDVLDARSMYYAARGRKLLDLLERAQQPGQPRAMANAHEAVDIEALRRYHSTQNDPELRAAIVERETIHRESQQTTASDDPLSPLVIGYALLRAEAENFYARDRGGTEAGPLTKDHLITALLTDFDTNRPQHPYLVELAAKLTAQATPSPDLSLVSGSGSRTSAFDALS